IGLRELICHKYQLFEMMKTRPENIVVANGSGQALSLAFSAFVDPGDAIIIEAPTFSGSLNTIRRHGPRILDVPVDDEGIVTDAVRERLQTLRREGRRCKLIYTIVNFQNPAGPSQSLRRRQELIALAHEYDTLILEDDAYGELRFEGETLPPLYALDRGGRVIRAGTLSKILGAGVRLGWPSARSRRAFSTRRAPSSTPTVAARTTSAWPSAMSSRTSATRARGCSRRLCSAPERLRLFAGGCLGRAARARAPCRRARLDRSRMAA